MIDSNNVLNCLDVCLERFSRSVLISDNSVNVMHGFDTQPLLGLHRQPQAPVWDMSISDWQQRQFVKEATVKMNTRLLTVVYNACECTYMCACMGANVCTYVV
jgi:hypothetical protein